MDSWKVAGYRDTYPCPSTSAPKLQSDIYYIPEDAHPTGKAYALVAEALSKFLVQHFPSIGALLQSRGGQ